MPATYDALTVPQLKDVCRQKGLRVGGLRAELIQRLVDAETLTEEFSSSDDDESVSEGDAPGPVHPGREETYLRR